MKRWQILFCAVPGALCLWGTAFWAALLLLPPGLPLTYQASAALHTPGGAAWAALETLAGPGLFAALALSQPGRLPADGPLPGEPMPRAPFGPECLAAGGQ